MLHAELARGVPDRSEMYTRLLVASRILHGRRAAILSDGSFDAMAAKFETRLAPLKNRLMNVGLLFISAVTDEIDGVPSSVESLTGWSTDPDRFSGEWIRAVEETVGETRGLMVL